ncbi:hypothetical protein LCL97_12310 [Seohaeicola saemankumensis]|nr:hypothetical protein [Seohaeicola saemankumensis]MCA0871612.1 hypothetical protein [Seohaeicola saemankumensis]
MTRLETLKLGCLCVAICLGLIVHPVNSSHSAAADKQGIGINQANG